MKEENFVAVRSESLSKPGDVRYILLDRQTRNVIDDAGGRGYKSPEAAHKSYAFKQKFKNRRKPVQPK